MSVNHTRPGLEVLEEREVPASLQLIGNTLFYTSAAGVANNVTVSHAAGTFTFSDSVEGTTLTAASAGVTNVDVNSGDRDDVVRVLNTPVAVRVSGGSENDLTLVGNGSLDGIQGTVTAVGGGVGDRLYLLDQADTSNNNFLISTGQVLRNGALVVQHVNQEVVRLNSGVGADLIDVTANTPNTTTVLDGGLGSDTMTGSNVMNTWRVYGVNQVSLSMTNLFNNVENIQGGFNDNTVVFESAGQMTGWFAGGGGVNTLDYSLLNTDVTANLLAGTATKLGGGLALGTVQNLIGGSGNDQLTGDTGNNLIDGGAGQDIISGRGGNDILLGGAGNDQVTGGNGFDILIGGLGRDILNGGGGSDILIGGTTSYDGDKAALNLFRTLWTAGGSYLDITTNVEAAGLDAANVFGDNTTDALTGGAGLDWFWDEGASDTLTDWFWLEKVNA